MMYSYVVMSSRMSSTWKKSSCAMRPTSGSSAMPHAITQPTYLEKAAGRAGERERARERERRRAVSDSPRGIRERRKKRARALRARARALARAAGRARALT